MSFVIFQPKDLQSSVPKDLQSSVAMAFLFPSNNRKTDRVHIHCIYPLQGLPSPTALFFCQIISFCGVRRTLENAFAQSDFFEARNWTVLRLDGTYRARGLHSLGLCVFSCEKPSLTTSLRTEIKCRLYSNLTTLRLFQPCQYCEHYRALDLSQNGAWPSLGWRNYESIQKQVLGSDWESNSRPLAVPC